jgi:kynurenine formamidase
MKGIGIVAALLLGSLWIASAAAAGGPAPEGLTLGQAWQVIKTRKFVDLTHAFAPGIPRWQGFPDEQRETLYGYEPGAGRLGSGFYAQAFTHVGQWGTHVDPPAHFVKGLRTVDQIDVKEMILPLVVIDVHEKASLNPDYTLALADVLDWERRHGPVPEGAFVAMRTDWSRRWPSMEAMHNRDGQGIAHHPGWSLDALRYLYEQRRITASGHETTDTDPGIATAKNDYSLETYILKRNRYQIELLANLDQVPEAGALVVVTFPKPRDGSGFPARVFAILP